MVFRGPPDLAGLLCLLWIDAVALCVNEQASVLFGHRTGGKAVEQVKKVSFSGGDTDEGIDAEKQGFATAFLSEDGKEGISAFLGKRSPPWQGK